MIHAANRNGDGLVVEALSAGNCNETSVTSAILRRQLVPLRDESELLIKGEDGALKPRAKTVAWSDHLVLLRERSLFSRLGW